ADGKTGHVNVSFNGDDINTRIGQNLAPEANNPIDQVDLFSANLDGLVGFENETQYDNPSISFTITVSRDQFYSAFNNAMALVNVPVDSSTGGNNNYVLFFNSCVNFAQSVWRNAGQSGFFLQEIPIQSWANAPGLVWAGLLLSAENTNSTLQHR